MILANSARIISTTKSFTATLYLHNNVDGGSMDRWSRLVSRFNVACGSCFLLALGLSVLAAPALASDQTVGSSADAVDATATSSAVAPAASGPPAAGGLQEVIVTATRREEALSKVPISVQSITNAQMEIAGVREIDDLARLTPEVKISYGGETGSADVSIRGISSDAGASTTGVYIDDTPIQVVNRYNSAGEQFPAVFDLQRVEVLRGLRARCSAPGPRVAQSDSFRSSRASRSTAGTRARRAPAPTVTRPATNSELPTADRWWTTCWAFA
jgi:hypothetical protein